MNADYAAYAEIAEEHRRWLAGFSEERVRRWNLLLSADPEAALCEACVRKLLQGHVESIEPVEDLSRGGPDFLCQNAGHRFYVEATCLTTEAVTFHTGLPPDLDEESGSLSFSDLTSRIQKAAINKAPQCADLDAPCLLAVGTLHFMAAAVCCSGAYGACAHVKHGSVHAIRCSAW